jgi:transcription initiation factor TFIIB
MTTKINISEHLISEISDQDIFDNYNFYKNFSDNQTQETENYEKYEKYENNQDCCQYCGLNELVDSTDGFLICQNCSFVNEKIIDDSQEWRYYGAEDSKNVDPTRCGLPTNNFYPEACLGSGISSEGSGSYQMRKIANYNRYNTITHKTRTLYDSLNMMTIYASNGGIAQCIIEEAKNMYWKIVQYRASHNLNEYRKPNREAILAASILEASKTLNYHRSAEEIAQIFQIKKTDVINGHKHFRDYWKIICDQEENGQTVYGEKLYTKPSKPSDYINRFCSKLGLDQEIKDICNNICQRIEEKNIIPAYVPISIASGVIYLINNILGHGLTKEEISEKCDNVSEATIEKCYQDLEKNLEDILPEYLVNILVSKINL